MTSPVCLVVLDGFGVGRGDRGDATALANAPFFERCNRLRPRAQLEASGAAVGLPPGQMGSSEVGHLTLGAGRVVEQDSIRIQRAIEAGELGALPAVEQTLEAAERAGGVLHLLGLVSDGGVHGSLGHLQGVIALLESRGLRPVLHAFTDGRDAPPRSALVWLRPLEERLRERGGCIATVSGRYWAMDRDGRWERIARVWRAIVEREGIPADSAVDAIEKGYARGEGDEFISPSVVGDAPPLRDEGVAFFLNFRADRARQLTNALTRARPERLGGEVSALPRIAPGHFTCLTCYDAEFGLPVAFRPIEVPRGLGEVLSEAGLTQLRIAETEKYAHVTYFFNGGTEEPFEGEDRILIPSPTDVPTYDWKPEMSAVRLTDELLEALARKDYAFVLVNYANPDMVGHTGVLPAAVCAVEVVAACLDRVVEVVLARGGSLLITGDHGNIEQLVDPGTAEPHTAHTRNPVPVWWVAADGEDHRLAGGSLVDVAPTLCARLGLSPPPEMTGRNLIR